MPIFRWDGKLFFLILLLMTSIFKYLHDNVYVSKWSSYRTKYCKTLFFNVRLKIFLFYNRDRETLASREKIPKLGKIFFQILNFSTFE